MKMASSIIFAALIAAMSSLVPAHAGDFASRHIHGFSMDGNLFAFEEYGIQDGSGFPYANIYVIDTRTDQWTANSPYRALLQDETKSVFDAREEARILAGTVMKSFEDRGNIVATNHATELGIDRKRVLANPRFVVPPIDETIEFRISTQQFQSTPFCEPFGPTTGFSLHRIATQAGDTTTLLYSDETVPDSRGCPQDYDIADLVTYYPETGSPKAAILILVTKLGFEGPDGRFLAVTTQLE